MSDATATHPTDVQQGPTPARPVTSVHGRSLDELIACPSCDALYQASTPEPGQRAVCSRCHRVLIAPKKGAVLRIVALSITILILLKGALFLPFLEISVRGLSHATSVFDAALAFTGPFLSFLSVAVVLLIVGIPLLRVVLTLYALGPIAFGRTPFSGAARAFRISEELRPWAMAEIFVIGAAVALVKIAALARVEFGPAFFMFAVFVLIVILQDGFMCRWSIWRILDKSKER